MSKLKTIKEMLNVVLNHRDDINALLNKTRPRELKDSIWLWENNYVRYGADTALSQLAHKLQDLIEEEENKEGDN